MKQKGLAMVAFLVLISITSIAQESGKRFGIELNGGGSMAINKLSDAKTNPGFGFEGLLSYRIMPHFGLIAGWGWQRFGAETSFAGSDVCFEETGYLVGLEYSRPFGSAPLSWFFRGAGLYNHIEIENESGDIIHDTKHGYGWQAAGGIMIPLGSKWNLSPGLKFNSLQRETIFEGNTHKLNLNYFSLRVGLTRRF
jgi:hypothetical protein